jgi:hypothetical protein
LARLEKLSRQSGRIFLPRIKLMSADNCSPFVLIRGIRGKTILWLDEFGAPGGRDLSC